MKEVYFDNSATTKVDDNIIEAMAAVEVQSSSYWTARQFPKDTQWLFNTLK